MDEAAERPLPGRRVRRRPRRPQADHQPLAVAQLPDDPHRALRHGTTSCCSATPRRPRISRSAPAPSSPWRTRSRCSRRSAPTPSVPDGARRLRPRPPRRGRAHAARRRRVAGLVRAAASASRHMDPTQFAFGLMTRSRSITYDNLRLRAPAFVARDRRDVRRRRARGRGSTPRAGRRRCSSRSSCAAWRSPTASWSRRCACIRPTTACPATGTSCITAPARSAAPGWCSPR